MQVLITISPVAWVAWPPRSPKTVNPSSRTRTIGSGMLQHPLRHHLTATDGHDDPSAQSPTLERGVLAATLEGRRIDRPLFMGIDQDPFVFQRLAGDLSRPGYAGAVDDPTIQAESEDDADGGLEAMEAVSARFLGCPLMRRVIGGDRVDYTIQQGMTEGIPVIGRSQRRIDIAVRSHGPGILLGEGQVMRRGLGGDRQVLRLRSADQLDGAAGGGGPGGGGGAPGGGGRGRGVRARARAGP